MKPKIVQLAVARDEKNNGEMPYALDADGNAWVLWVGVDSGPCAWKPLPPLPPVEAPHD